jgi:uncharacterized protein YvpB
LAYYGKEVLERKLMEKAQTSPQEGTRISSIEKVLKSYGLQYDARPMEIKDIKSYIRKKIPVLILLQARSDQPRDYTNDYQDGHRVVAIGYEKDTIFFEDPYTFKRTFSNEPKNSNKDDIAKKNHETTKEQ